MSAQEEREDEYINDEDAEEIIHEESDDGGEEPMSDEDENEGDDQFEGTQLEMGEGYGQEDFRISADGTTMVFDPDGDFDEGAEGSSAQKDAGEDNSLVAAVVHKEDSSVFDIALHPAHPNPSLAVSGGEDDMGYIFDTANGQKLVELSGHTDSVVAVAFSSDGQFVATGGMDGRVRVWKRVGTEDWNNWEFLTSLEGPDEVTCLTWHPKGPVLAVGSNDTTVWMWQLPSGNTMQVFAGHTDAITAISFTPDGKRLLTTSADSFLIVWDPRSPSPSQTFNPTDGRFNLADGITSLAIHPSSNLAVVGGGAGGIRVVNLIKSEVVRGFQGHKEEESVESLVFLDIAGNGVVVSAGTDGKAFVWDVTTGRLRSTLEHPEAITSIRLHPAPMNHLLTTASADATLKTWDVRNGSLIAHHKGHQAVINALAVGSGGEGKSAIVTAGDDGASLVWLV
ncbi:Angio-associated migratory cell protein (contains WD40 repeats) [Phaffia rhodozyma]|uniref:Angio-associated migratory cell protein (Contains WD40 repeats) n=1 Tax=Phaffia rhodozyma TaxID=264483 RepID=A0A0F7SRJ0_PHARH|nr:Angio-associated migratory cell protein (contains WD40 repeats) [Phaffia rhodozyma]